MTQSTTLPANESTPDSAAGSPWTVRLMALLLFLAPAVGYFSNELRQETLKVVLLGIGLPAACALYLWSLRRVASGIRVHLVIALPILLTVWAVGSAFFVDSYPSILDAARWLIVALLIGVGTNTLTRERLPLLSLAIAMGATLASVWAALQFWGNISPFAQGPNPASTFGNRNFFAEFAVVALPFSVLLLVRARRTNHIALLSISTALIVVALMMTGTRSALLALLALSVVLPLMVWIVRRHLAWPQWTTTQRVLAPGLLVLLIGGLGSIATTHNNRIYEEARGTTPFARAFTRVSSISGSDESFNVRLAMWKDTFKMIESSPISGLGAGSWERESPRFRDAGGQIELDYYAHNEYLQLAAEYGVAGWLFIALLIGFLAIAARRTWVSRHDNADTAWRATALVSMLAMLVVSSAGFPWHMACTTALLAINLAILAAADSRTAPSPGRLVKTMGWWPASTYVGVAAVLLSISAIAVWAQRTMAGETRIMRAANLALGITASGNPGHPALAATRQQVLQLVREGVGYYPRYRHVTSGIADEFARWGDWQNATWIWESVTPSHPNVVVILTNIARGYLTTNNQAKAQEYLERARKIQPDAPVVVALDVMLAARGGQSQKAIDLARAAMDRGLKDYGMYNAAYVAAVQLSDNDMAIRALKLRLQHWPAERAVEGYLQLGSIYAQGRTDSPDARQAFEQAWRLAPPAQRPALLAQIPPAYRPTAQSPGLPVPMTQR